MNLGSDPAEQVVRMMLSGSEVALRLSGSALKNGLAMLFAMIKNHKKVYGKVNMTKLLRETRDVRTFPMKPAQFQQFQRYAKQFRVLYAGIQDKGNRHGMIDVLLPVTELERANMIFEKIKFVPEKEQHPAKEQRDQAKENPERKKESRSERDSSVTRDSSSTPSGKESRTMNERPSVLDKLKGFAAEKQEAGVPARTRAKSRPKAR